MKSSLKSGWSKTQVRYYQFNSKIGRFIQGVLVLNLRPLCCIVKPYKNKCTVSYTNSHSANGNHSWFNSVFWPISGSKIVMSTLTYLYSLLCVTFCFFMLCALYAVMQGLLPQHLRAFAHFKILIQRYGPQRSKRLWALKPYLCYRNV